MKHGRLIKFLISGISAATVEYVVFLCLHIIISDKFLIISQSVSFLCGFIVSFLLNKRWVFQSTGHIKHELFRYTTLALINLILSNIFMWLLVVNVHIVFWIAKFIVMIIIATWNYFIFQKLIFQNNN